MKKFKKTKAKNKSPGSRNDSFMRSHELLNDLMRLIPDVIYFKDKHGRLVLVNEAHARGLGLTPQQVIGKTDFDIFPKDRAKKMWDDDLRVIKSGKPIIDKIERATRADGADNYVSTTKIPRYDAKGNVIGLIGITRDITKRIHLEQLTEQRLHIEKKFKALEDLHKIKSEFISVISHELRTPLAIVQDAVLLISEGLAGPTTEKQRELIAKAKNNIERLKKMIDELLDLSRIENSQFKLQYSLVNFNDLLQDSSEFFRKLAHDKNITLEYGFPEKQVNIFLDYERINQVVSNLITNAIKYTEPAGTIKVDLRILENRVRVGVIDTGVGISKEDLPKLFNRFMQLGTVREVDRKGVGLGLSIVKHLVEKHGGEIWAESKLGVGSKFYFTVPRFYTTSVLESDVRMRIDQLLEKDISVYLLNALIVNYALFKKRIKIEPKKLFNDLIVILGEYLKERVQAKTEKPQMIFGNARYGEFSVLYPEATEEEAEKVCRDIKGKIQQYLTDNQIENVFINMGVMSYSAESQLKTTQQLLANLYMKRVYIGSNVRRHQRIAYKANFDILSSKGVSESLHTVDISEGGLCFISRDPLRTDSEAEVRLKLPGNLTFLLKGRVAWMKPLEDLASPDTYTYKIGIEFMNLKAKDRKNLRKFITSIPS
ncbi:MAG: ATP-binding protein [Candidatus Omnitrophota bacterium]